MLNLDYTSIGLLSELSNEQKTLASADYGQILADLLDRLKCNPYYSRSIIMSILWTSMSDKSSYHTPMHVLSILSFAQQHNIMLEDWEVLAIYFHDAIYRPTSKKNETNSIQYMLALLADTGIPDDVLTLAAFGIRATAFHLDEDVGNDVSKLMDLDMSMFALSTAAFLKLCDGIEQEYRRDVPNFDGCDEITYLTGRMKFLQTLKNKKSVFRTQQFLEMWESVAQENILAAIKAIEDRLAKNI